MAAEAHARGHSLECRRGSGKATYHRYNPQRKAHVIVYGRLMVKDKVDTARTGSGHLERWLTAREIRRHRYFGGELTLERALLHTCLHEFAHLLQVIAGGRVRGSVHNRHFYRELLALHEAIDSSAALRMSMEFPQWLSTDPMFRQAIEKPAIQAKIESSSAVVLPVGSLVSFRFRGELIRARVLRKTRVNYQLEGTAGHAGQRFRCHPSLLHPG